MHGFNEENNSLKNLVKVLEADVGKLDDLEAQVEQMTELYEKEKDLNKQLLSSATNDGEDNGEDEDTGDEGDENAAASAGPSGSNTQPVVKVSGQATE